VSKCGSEETRNQEEARLRMGEGRENLNGLNYIKQGRDG